MAKVEAIQTEQDRLEAIDLLGPFIVSTSPLSSKSIKHLSWCQVELETNDESDKVSREFLELKRDVEVFIDALDRPARDAAASILTDIQT